MIQGILDPIREECRTQPLYEDIIDNREKENKINEQVFSR
jgi:hypothetical protein